MLTCRGGIDSFISFAVIRRRYLAQSLPQFAWYSKFGSDSSTPFRCQPAGHLAQSLTSCASLRMKLFHFPLLAQASLARNWKQKSLPANAGRLCRGEGIRTLGKLETYTRFPSVLLKPLGHPSRWVRGVAKIANYFDESKKESISFLNWTKEGLWI